MSTATDLDDIVSASVDLLTEARSLQTGYQDPPLFGGATRLDVAIAKSRALTESLYAAKASFVPLLP